MSNIKKRGFASMDKKRARELASLGGKRTHELGKRHKWNSEEAKEAGKVGGRNSAVNREATKRLKEIIANERG